MNNLNNQNSKPSDVTNCNIFELDVNNSFWSEALSTIDKKKLIEICDKFNIPTKGKDRYRLASNLSKRINLNTGVKLFVEFDICDSTKHIYDNRTKHISDDNLRFKAESEKSLIYDSKTDNDMCMYVDEESKKILLNLLNTYVD